MDPPRGRRMVKNAPGKGNIFGGSLSRSASPDTISAHSKNSKKSSSRMRNAFACLEQAVTNFGKDGREPYSEQLHTKDSKLSKLNLKPLKLGQKHQPLPSAVVVPPPVKPKIVEPDKPALPPPKINFKPEEKKEQPIQNREAEKKVNKPPASEETVTVIEEIWESVEDELVSRSSKLRQQQRVKDEASKIPESANRLARQEIQAHSGEKQKPMMRTQPIAAEQQPINRQVDQREQRALQEDKAIPHFLQAPEEEKKVIEKEKAAQMARAASSSLNFNNAFSNPDLLHINQSIEQSNSGKPFVHSYEEKDESDSPNFSQIMNNAKPGKVRDQSPPKEEASRASLTDFLNNGMSEDEPLRQPSKTTHLELPPSPEKKSIESESVEVIGRDSQRSEMAKMQNLNVESNKVLQNQEQRITRESAEVPQFFIEQSPAEPIEVAQAVQKQAPVEAAPQQFDFAFPEKELVPKHEPVIEKTMDFDFTGADQAQPEPKKKVVVKPSPAASPAPVPTQAPVVRSKPNSKDPPVLRNQNPRASAAQKSSSAEKRTGLPPQQPTRGSQSPSPAALKQLKDLRAKAEKHVNEIAELNSIIQTQMKQASLAKKQQAKIVGENTALSKEVKELKKQNAALQSRVKELQTMPRQQTFEEKQNIEELLQLREAYNQLKNQYTELTSKTIEKTLKQEPSNLSAPHAGPLSNQQSFPTPKSYSQRNESSDNTTVISQIQQQFILPTPNEQELIRENKFLKQRIAVQQQQLCANDSAYQTQQNSLLRARVVELEAWAEELQSKNEDLQQILSKQEPELFDLKAAKLQKEELEGRLSLLEDQLKFKSERLEQEEEKHDLKLRLMDDKLRQITEENRVLQSENKSLMHERSIQSELRGQFESFVKNNILQQLCHTQEQIQQFKKDQDSSHQSARENQSPSIADSPPTSRKMAYQQMPSLPLENESQMRDGMLQESPIPFKFTEQFKTLQQTLGSNQSYLQSSLPMPATNDPQGPYQGGGTAGGESQQLLKIYLDQAKNLDLTQAQQTPSNKTINVLSTTRQQLKDRNFHQFKTETQPRKKTRSSSRGNQSRIQQQPPKPAKYSYAFGSSTSTGREAFGQGPLPATNSRSGSRNRYGYQNQNTLDLSVGSRIQAFENHQQDRRWTMDNQRSGGAVIPPQVARTQQQQHQPRHAYLNLQEFKRL